MTNFLAGINSDIINGLCLILFTLSINYNKFTKKEIIYSIIITLVSVASLLVTGSFSMLKLSMFVLGCKYKDINKIVKVLLYSSAISFFFNVATALLSGTDLYIESNFGRGEIERRLAFGFKSPNNLHAFFLFISLCFLYTKDRYKKNIFLILFLALNIILYQYTISRTGLVIGLVATFILFTTKTIQSSKKILKIPSGVLSLIYIIICLLPIILLTLYNTDIVQSINTLATNRLLLANRFVEEYGIHLFGARISGDHVVDLGVISFIVRYGIIPFFIYAISQVLLIRKYCNKKDLLKLSFIFTFLLYGLSEDVLYYVFINISTLFFSDLGLKESKEKK